MVLGSFFIFVFSKMSVKYITGMKRVVGQMNKYSVVSTYLNQEMGARKGSLHMNSFGPTQKDGHDILLMNSFCFIHNF